MIENNLFDMKTIENIYRKPVNLLLKLYLMHRVKIYVNY